MNDPLEQAIREARKALTCIYLIAEEVVADDVKNKMEDVFTAIIHALAQREREVWEEAAKLVLSFGSHSSNPNDPSAPWVCSPIYEQCKGLAKALRQHAKGVGWGTKEV